MVDSDLTVYCTGDLVTYRKDLLGVQGHIGIVTHILDDGDNVRYMVVRWSDGEVYPELGRHLILLARAKSES